MDEPNAVLRVSGLRVAYGDRAVLHDIGFVLEPGVMLGLLGANGAGKSTLLRAISGQLRPRAGTISIAGTDLGRDPLRAKTALGYAVDPAALPLVLTARQYLELVGSARRLHRTQWWPGDPVAALDAAAFLDRSLAECSLGTRAKFAICAALIGSPPLLILDESLNGLDPLAAWQAKTLVRDAVSTGRTSVILATHAIETVIALCDRALFLDEGRIAHDWGREDLESARRDSAAFEARLMTALLGRRVFAANGQG